jgi:hypothetical protein
MHKNHNNPLLTTSQKSLHDRPHASMHTFSQAHVSESSQDVVLEHSSAMHPRPGTPRRPWNVDSSNVMRYHTPGCKTLNDKYTRQCNRFFLPQFPFFPFSNPKPTLTCAWSWRGACGRRPSGPWPRTHAWRGPERTRSVDRISILKNNNSHNCVGEQA